MRRRAHDTSRRTAIASLVAPILCAPLVTLAACTARVPPSAAGDAPSTTRVPVASADVAASDASVGRPAAETALDADVAPILDRACYPCHSDERRDPWYAKLAPSSWSTRGARAALNFSVWPRYGAERRTHAAAAAAVAEAGTMPPADYTFFNHAAKLTDEDKHALVRWAAQPNP
jgi:hypothetical protein